ncbi:MAG: type II CAAX endopeptidase family protein [Planctomycetota bacterium]
MSHGQESLDLPYGPLTEPNLGPANLGPEPGWTTWGRWWSPFVVAAISLITFIVGSGLMLVLAFYVVHGQVDRRMLASSEAMMAVSSSRLGLVLLVAAPQMALVLPSLIAALLSPERIGRRLSLVRGHWPYWVWAAAAVVTPLVGWISSIAVGAFMEESENLQMMSEIFRTHGETGFLIPLALLIGATPALCEELLFRGYIQTRLNTSFGVIAAILISSSLFAVFHMDPVHIVAVFPLGLYLGLISWRSGSLFPAMLGHFVNNTVSVVSVVLSPEADSDSISPAMSQFLTVVLVLGATGLVSLIYAWKAYPMRALEEPDRAELGNSGDSPIDPPEDGPVAV